MTQLEPARELARTMVGIGNSHGVEVTALITNMDQPLGRMVGNANEIAESIDVLKGGGPDDLVEITRALAEEMLDLAGLDGAEASVQRAITSGDALERFARMVEEQGGNPAVVDDPTLLPFADETTTLTADGAGVVVECDSRLVGLAAMRLGAGRTRTDDEIDPGVGIEVVARRGTVVERGDPLAVLRHRRSDLSDALELAKRAWVIGDEAPATAPMVWERISSAGF